MSLRYNGKLTGKVTGTIVNAETKGNTTKTGNSARKSYIEQAVAIGDGANDLPMLSTVGLEIFYHAKDIVRKKPGIGILC